MSRLLAGVKVDWVHVDDRTRTDKGTHTQINWGHGRHEEWGALGNTKKETGMRPWP